MYQFIIRRLLLSIPTILIVSFFVFYMVRLNPDAVITARLGEAAADATEEQKEAIRDEYGLNNPVVTEYLSWMGNVARGDWGQSAYTFQNVLPEMGPKIAVTFELAFLAMLFSVLIGIPIGVLSAMRQDEWPDYVLRSGAILGLAVPNFYIATIVLALLARNFGWIPSISYRSPLEDLPHNLSQMWLPALILSLATAAQITRYARTMMLEVLRQDYIRTAWAKGLTERVVVARHALKNALLPVVTVIGLTTAFLVGGTVIFETLFSLPGLGTHLVNAVIARDFAVVQGVTLFYALAVIVVNLVVDLSYSYLDPRARG